MLPAPTDDCIGETDWRGPPLFLMAMTSIRSSSNFFFSSTKSLMICLSEAKRYGSATTGVVVPFPGVPCTLP